jgi:hypothetical protein
MKDGVVFKSRDGENPVEIGHINERIVDGGAKAAF